jgi:hypothetical protein
MSNDVDNLILYFTASWCEPCKKTKPIVEQLNLDQTIVRFFIIDAEYAKEMATDFGIDTVPTFILIKDGAVVERTSGQKNKTELEEMVNYYK